MKTKILMVCLGNICRSPLAEGILASKLPCSDFFVDSAGTAGYHIGKSPDSRSVKTAARHGIDISEQCCRQLHTSDLEIFDIIYAMDQSNYTDIKALATTPQQHDKVKLIMEEVGEPISVPDPYYGGGNGFENVYKMLDLACEQIANRLKSA